ncbi:hypothetical protein HR45_01710 [Shewanella mangrovi]|uniref:Uncharacterized protein n=1 Tax=Shewanella mangrovi TaxID=1515746 RepID=A0A094JGP3_9GAMM|nr:hypothetical protein [Shewanella mangrovi]KFZ39140.1 hypothetical protein HR45_01710 [Shewanella mangrovi]
MNNTDWKDHPISIAAVAVAATIGLCILIGKEIVLPTYTASLNNTIELLKNEKNKIETEKKSIENKAEALTKKLGESDSTNKDLLKKLEQAQYGNLFSNGDPYPVGLGSVRIGDPAKSILKIYPKASIDVDKKGFITIKNQHQLFNDIVYYVNEDDKNLPITHIMYRINYTTKIDDNFLQKKLIDSFGLPEEWEWDNYYSWQTKSKLIIYKDDDRSIILMNQNYSPGTWPRRKSCSQLTKN